MVAGLFRVETGLQIDGYVGPTNPGSITYDPTGSGTFYFSTASGTTPAGGGGGSIGGPITSSTSGSVLFIDASGNLAQDNANFFWNDSTIKLGIGNNAPQSFLHIGSATITGLTGGATPGYIVALDDTFSAADGAMNALVHSGSFAQDKGGSLGFAGTYQAGNAVAMWARISGKKETSGSGDYGGYLAFETRPFGGGITDRLHIKSTGEVYVTGSTFGVNTLNYIWPGSQSANSSLKNNGTGTLSWFSPSPVINNATLRASPIVLSSGSAVNVATITLLAGTYEMSAMLGMDFTGMPYNTSGTNEYVDFGISQSPNIIIGSGQTNNPNFTNPGEVRYFNTCTASKDNGLLGVSYTIPPIRFTITSTTTYYLVTYAIFSIGTASAYGSLNAVQI